MKYIDEFRDKELIDKSITAIEKIDIDATIMEVCETHTMAISRFGKGITKLENQYTRSVKEDGNKKALNIMYEVFEICDSDWRGIGIISNSGLNLRSKYKEFDAENIEVEEIKSKEPEGCICGEILRGIKIPLDCSLFGKICTPTNPIGPCMVSSEGSCAAYYKYGR